MNAALSSRLLRSVVVVADAVARVGGAHLGRF